MSRGGVPSAIASSSLRRARADERVVHVALVIANGALHTLDGLLGGVPLPTPALPRRTTNAYRMANRYDRPEVEQEWHDASWQDAPGEILPGCDDARYSESQEGRQARGLCRSHARYQPRPRHSSTSLSPGAGTAAQGDARKAGAKRRHGGVGPCKYRGREAPIRSYRRRDGRAHGWWVGAHGVILWRTQGE